MKKYGYIVLSALFIGVTNVAAQSETTEAAIQQEYAAAKELHKRGEMIEAGNGYCNVLEHYHKTYGNESLEYAEVMQSIASYCTDNGMHQDALIAAPLSYAIYGKIFVEGMKHFASSSEFIEKMEKTPPEHLRKQDVDKLATIWDTYERKEREYHSSSLHCVEIMSAQSPLMFKQIKHTNYELDIEKFFKKILGEFLSLKKEGKGEKEYVRTLLQMGRFYLRTEKPAQAQALFLDVVKLVKGTSILGANETYRLKNDIIAYYLAQGKVKQAKSVLEELLSADLEIPKGVSEIVYGITLNQKANMAILQGDERGATNYLNRAFEKYNQNLPSLAEILRTNNLPDFMTALCLTARLYSQQKQIGQAVAIYEKTTDILKRIFLEQGADGFDSEMIWNVMAGYFDDVYRFAWEHKLYDFLYEHDQFTNYLFSATIAYGPKNIDLYSDTAWRKQKEQLDSLSRSPSMLNTYMRGDMTPKIITDIRYTNLRKQLYGDLFRKNLIPVRWPLSREKLRATLNPQEAAIEFMTIHTADTRKEYGAFVVTNETQSPVFIPICTEQELKNVVDTRTLPNRLELYNLLWKPLEAAIKDRSCLYISSSDLLNRVSFAGIKTPDGYLCDKYMIRTVRSISYVDCLKENGVDDMAGMKNFFLYGGADFGLPTGKSSITRGQGFSYLPGSKREVNEIARSLSDKWKVELFIGGEATEEQFAKLSYKQESPCVVHVSTHGFYLSYTPEERAEKSAPQVKSYASFYEPLLRSGFALSGANRSWNKGGVPTDLHDGILTGYEISSLNLSNTELVVLSACNTGLQEIRDGTVSRGLQQAFFSAGARSIITSLWEVPDKETELFMKEFYAQWMSGITLSQAFVDTQRMMRTRYPDDPEKWAGFILME